MDKAFPPSVLRPAAVPTLLQDALLDGTSVAASQERCLAVHKLTPDRVARPCVLTPVELQDHREPIADLLALSQGEVQRLFELLAEQDYVVMLADPDGVALSFRSTELVLDACTNVGVLPGSIWAEDKQGTNGVALCIQERRALSVVMQDHFASSLAGVSCTVAPVFGAAGQLAGVLNVTTLRGSDRAAQALVRQVVTASARRIENQFFDRRNAGHTILRLSRHGDFCDAAAESRIAVDPSGRVLDATPLAQRILVPNGESLIGLSLSEIEGLDRWAKAADCGDVAFHLPNGSKHFFRFEQPRVRSTQQSGTTRARVPDPLDATQPTAEEIVGSDPVVRDAMSVAQRLIAHRVPVFLQGETGTGKSALARALHMDAGGTPDKFIAINCAAITAELIESELFGYRPGAFTGAARQGSRGRLLEADGGTLFLDEIGDMPVALQTRLLQVLSDGEFTPVGATRPVQVRFALIAASLHDVAEQVREGRFREDLYFRLAGATVCLPALRHRDDRRQLIERAVKVAARRVGRPAPLVDEDAMQALMSHNWPGNLRELHHAIRFAVAMDTDGKIDMTELPPPLGRKPGSTTLGSQPVGKRAAIEQALNRCNWNVSEAAISLGISRATLHRQLHELGIQRPT
ncbi:sigma-54-dependent Fis family transcriptional regulator [Variovorax sp. GT1P44]|uniref:sigma-54-dependent Fis family transcriptional regulator n=1 Tax=Variovorax sp. GT1P44 TaxID=3443742 RepID=UPI003F4483FE